uniref:Ig-like domain-containing protein n=1 Tax=Ditylenchus dipsaci TaxID=166011 RepID=A0A915DCR8_9BILA
MLNMNLVSDLSAESSSAKRFKSGGGSSDEESISEAPPKKSSQKSPSSPMPLPNESKKTDESRQNSLARLQGQQVGKRTSSIRDLNPIQQMAMQLKKVQKSKKESLVVQIDAPELKHHGSPSPDPSPRNSLLEPERRDTLLTPDFDPRSATDLEKRRSTSPNMRRRSSVHMRRESIGDVLEKPTTPLKPIGEEGTPARILEIPENVTVMENELAILKCVVEGNPQPTFTWTKGGREVVPGGRVRFTTDGDAGFISLIIGKCRPTDEGDYLLTVKNKYGSDSVEAKLLVSNESGLDFRAMLKKRESKSGSTYDKDEDKQKNDAERRQSLFPGKRLEKWDEQVDKIAELKCVYSRPNAKVRWYKDRKEIFSGGLKYKIVINKSNISLVINNPDVDDSGKYTCEANSQPTHSMVTVEEIYRTKQGVLTCKLNSARAPVVWHCGGKPIDVNDKRFVIEKDAVGRCTLTIKVVEDKDQAEWMAKVNNEVYSKVMVYVEEPRETFVVPLKSQRANERESATFECDVNDRDYNVEWWHDGKKITIDGKRFKDEKVGGSVV